MVSKSNIYSGLSLRARISLRPGYSCTPILTLFARRTLRPLWSLWSLWPLWSRRPSFHEHRADYIRSGSVHDHSL